MNELIWPCLLIADKTRTGNRFIPSVADQKSMRTVLSELSVGGRIASFLICRRDLFMSSKAVCWTSAKWDGFGKREIRLI